MTGTQEHLDAPDDVRVCANINCDRPAATCLGHLGILVDEAERMAASKERARIVEWLRTGRWRMTHDSTVGAVDELANQIERGEHV